MRRYVTDAVLVKSTEISRFDSQIYEHATRPSLQPLTSDLPRSSAIAVSVEAEGTFPVPENCSEIPDIHCTRRSLHVGVHALASHCPLLQSLTFSADPRSVIAYRKAADSHQCLCLLCLLCLRCLLCLWCLLCRRCPGRF